MESKTLEDLLNLNQTSDERIIYLLSMLLTMFDTTYFTNVDLYLARRGRGELGDRNVFDDRRFCVISCKMVELTFEYGNSTISTGAYSMLSLAILCLQMNPTFAYQVDLVAVCLA
jgi:hypothetical protein